MKIYIAAVLISIGLLGSSLANSQPTKAIPIPSGKTPGRSAPSIPKNIPKQIPPIATVMTINRSTVKVCGRNKVDGKVEQHGCKVVPLPSQINPAAKHIEMEVSNRAHVWVSVYGRKASLCKLGIGNRLVHCIPLSAAVPGNVDIKYVSLADTVKFMRYTPKAGFTMSDVNVNEVNAFNEALEQVTVTTRSILRAERSRSARPGRMSNICDKDEVLGGGCFEDDLPDPMEDPGGDLPDYWDPEPTRDPGYWEPEPEPEQEKEPDYWEPLTEPMPESEPEPEPEPVETAGGACPPASKSIICIVGQRPPPPPVNPEGELPTGPAPWLPQAACDFLAIFCSEGQEPRDNNRGAGSEHRGKTLEELKVICYAIRDNEETECYTWYEIHKDHGILGACKQRSWDRLHACVETAKEQTDNGSHRAP